MISVAVAAYHGEKYITAQLESILCQIGDGDEIVVSDDAPGGETEAAVTALSAVYPNIKYIRGKSRGVTANFENALAACRGDVIFLCDQDDIWAKNKVSSVMSEIEKGALLVLHNCKETDSNLNVINESYFALRGSKKGIIKNFIKNSYMGCCMAFKRELLDAAMPFPKGIPMHDQWLGILGEKTGKVVFIDEPLIYHRIHGDNVTGGKTTLATKLMWRIKLLAALSGR